LPCSAGLSCQPPDSPRAHFPAPLKPSTKNRVLLFRNASKGVRTPMQSSSRRSFLQSASLSLVWASAHPLLRLSSLPELFENHFLEEFGYADVTLSSELHENQLQNTHSVLMNLSEDSMLKPLRQMSGQPAPGEDLGGWYPYDPDFDYRKTDTGFGPACPFGQWVSALARAYAIRPDPAVREKVLRLNRLYAQTISGDFYEKAASP